MDETSDGDHCERIELKRISKAAKRIGNLMELGDHSVSFLCFKAASPSSPSVTSIEPHLITPSRSLVNEYILNSPLEPDSEVVALKQEVRSLKQTVAELNKELSEQRRSLNRPNKYFWRKLSRKWQSSSRLV